MPDINSNHGKGAKESGALIQCNNDTNKEREQQMAPFLPRRLGVTVSYFMQSLNKDEVSGSACFLVFHA